MSWRKLLMLAAPAAFASVALARKSDDFNERLAERLRERIERPRWKPARLTEYHPDAPASERGREGGAYDRASNRKRGELHPVITVEQHQADPKRYPFVTVASDIELEGQTLRPGYGPRIYFADFPGLVFRIYDTGGNFYGTDKKVREPGHEPFDIATSWSGAGRGKFSGKLTTYRVDWGDVLRYPSELVQRVPPEAGRV